jgi:hypothetical protein
VRGNSQRLRKTLLHCAVAINVLALFVGPSTASAGPGRGSCGSWTVVSAVDSPGSLADVVVLSSNDAWAVGYTNDGPLALHWDGVTWTQVPAPNPAGAIGRLSAVSAVSTTDIWAVGSARGTRSRALIEHWNGVKWKLVPGARIRAGDRYLWGVDARTSHDVWAVGSQRLDSNSARTIAERWDGEVWRRVKTPRTGDATWNELQDVAAFARNGAWAIGYRYSPATAIAKHWNGRRFHDATVPSPGTAEVLSGIDGVSGSDIWAAGWYNDDRGFTVSLAEHWDGSRWTSVPSPNDGDFSTLLLDVEASSATDAWAVGYSMHAWNKAMTEHWDGSTWTLVSPADPGAKDSVLAGVDGVPGTTSAWAVGEAGGYPLTEYYC